MTLPRHQKRAAHAICTPLPLCMYIDDTTKQICMYIYVQLTSVNSASCKARSTCNMQSTTYTYVIDHTAEQICMYICVFPRRAWSIVRAQQVAYAMRRPTRKHTHKYMYVWTCILIIPQNRYLMFINVFHPRQSSLRRRQHNK